MAGERRPGLLQATVVVNGLVPFAILAWDAAHGRLGVNPVEFVTRTTGTLCLTFLMLTLAVTPIRRLTGWGGVMKLRRMLGLFAFFYGGLHLVTYLWFDQFFHLGPILADVVGRPFILIGLLAFGLMVPLAWTSTSAWVKRLGGERWRRLHRRVYAVAALGVLHYLLLVKADLARPLGFATALGVLLGVRLVWALRPPQPRVKTQRSISR